MKTPQVFRKAAVLAILLTGSLALAIFLAGCAGPTHEAQSPEGMKTSMAEGPGPSEDVGPGWQLYAGGEPTEAAEPASGGEMLQLAGTTEEGSIEAGTGRLSFTVGGEIIEESRQTLAAIPLEERTFGECLAQVEIPPQYQAVTEQILIPETGEYRTVTKKAMISEVRIEERAILCEADIKEDLVMELQAALSEEGFDPGPVDGMIGPLTMGALNEYQKANNLPVDEHLNLATIKALGLMK